MEKATHHVAFFVLSEHITSYVSHHRHAYRCRERNGKYYTDKHENEHGSGPVPFGRLRITAESPCQKQYLTYTGEEGE